MNNVCTMTIGLKIVGLGVKDVPIRCQSTKEKLSTFYDILNLKPGCTKKEIRNSFIKLSKLNHPDICGPSSTTKFVRINEAYNVLIDSNKKKLYDETLMHTKNNNNPIHYHYPQHKNSQSWKDIYNNPDNHWISSNFSIVGICISLLIIGSLVQFYGVKKSTSVRSLLIDESDERWMFLKEQKLMQMGKSKDELVDIFEKNVEKEYGDIVKK